MLGEDAYVLSKKYTDRKLGQIDRIEVLDADPVNPQERVLYFVPKNGGGGIPVTDYYFRFDAMQLDLTDGANVSLWPDLSGNGNDLSQANAAEQPIFLAAGLNGNPTVQFNNQSLSKSSFSLLDDAGATFFIVMQIDNTTSSSVVFTIGNEGSSTNAIGFRSSGSLQKLGTYLNTADGVANAALTTDLNGTLYSSSYNSAVITMYQDGAFVTDTAYTDPIGAHNLLRLGKDPNGGRPFTGRISEFILYSRALSESEISSMNSYLMDKWGI